MLNQFKNSLIFKNRLVSRYCTSSVGLQGKEEFSKSKPSSSESLIEALTSKYPQHTKAIQNLVAVNPQFHLTKIGLWDAFFSALQQFGFDAIDGINILLKEPQLFRISNRALLLILSRWNECPVSNDFMKLLLINRPELFFLPPVNVEQRVPSLQLLVSNQKSLTLLLLQCPNVLTEHWESVQSKFNYLTNVMQVEKTDIVNSCALSKSLEHIRLRHTLLEKCGMYVTPSQYEHKRVKNEKSSFKNPPLKRIVDNEDISFAKKICKISVEEFEVYKAMFEEGLRSDEEYNSGTESDSE